MQTGGWDVCWQMYHSVAVSDYRTCGLTLCGPLEKTAECVIWPNVPNPKYKRGSFFLTEVREKVILGRPIAQLHTLNFMNDSSIFFFAKRFLKTPLSSVAKSVLIDVTHGITCLQRSPLRVKGWQAVCRGLQMKPQHMEQISVEICDQFSLWSKSPCLKSYSAVIVRVFDIFMWNTMYSEKCWEKPNKKTHIKLHRRLHAMKSTLM